MFTIRSAEDLLVKLSSKQRKILSTIGVVLVIGVSVFIIFFVGS